MLNNCMLEVHRIEQVLCKRFKVLASLRYVTSKPKCCRCEAALKSIVFTYGALAWITVKHATFIKYLSQMPFGEIMKQSAQPLSALITTTSPGRLPAVSQSVCVNVCVHVCQFLKCFLGEKCLTDGSLITRG